MNGNEYVSENFFTRKCIFLDTMCYSRCANNMLVYYSRCADNMLDLIQYVTLDTICYLHVKCYRDRMRQLCNDCWQLEFDSCVYIYVCVYICIHIYRYIHAYMCANTAEAGWGSRLTTASSWRAQDIFCKECVFTRTLVPRGIVLLIHIYIYIYVCMYISS